PLPRARAEALVALTRSVAEGQVQIDPGADRDETEVRLKRLPGIGQWTASYVRMRALGDPDVFLGGDLGIKRALAGRRTKSDDSLEGCRPWRSYATVHLWTAAAAQHRRKEKPSP
ncbi:MAG TPA: DNA-3-methyladenine glycosylase 2 family protein, partial [Acidimicrobiales bacterium]|nr:DNA-3-methyladenine glycosylase 2 family protein [Acidimicrobiales bacterium]